MAVFFITRSEVTKRKQNLAIWKHKEVRNLQSRLLQKVECVLSVWIVKSPIFFLSIYNRCCAVLSSEDLWNVGDTFPSLQMSKLIPKGFIMAICQTMEDPEVLSQTGQSLLGSLCQAAALYFHFSHIFYEIC